jgi:hypothetical protein
LAIVPIIHLAAHMPVKVHVRGRRVSVEDSFRIL